MVIFLLIFGWISISIRDVGFQDTYQWNGCLH